MNNQSRTKTTSEPDSNNYVKATTISPSSHDTTNSSVAVLRVVTTTATVGRISLRYTPRDILHLEKAPAE